MADPLSITASILAVVGATGKTLHTLESVWELRHRDEDFFNATNQAGNANKFHLRILISTKLNGFQMQLRAVAISLPSFSRNDANVELFQDCIKDLERACVQVTRLLSKLDGVIRDARPKSSSQSEIAFSKPSVYPWIKRKASIVRLISQIKGIIDPLSTTLLVLQTHGLTVASAPGFHPRQTDLAVQNISIVHASGDIGSQEPNTLPVETQLEAAMQQVLDTEGAEREFEPIDAVHAQPFNPLSRTASVESFHTARSSSSTITSTFLSITGTLGLESCRRFCPCQCHITRHFQTPQWAKNVFGSIAVYGNGSILLGRRPCNKKFCGRSGATSNQFTYTAPAWMFLKSFCIQSKAQGVQGLNSSWTIRTPRLIPDNALVWQLVDTGRFSDFRDYFSLGLSSPYDVDENGESLMHYAANWFKYEFYDYLITQGGDPYFRNSLEVPAIQAVIDDFVLGHIIQEKTTDKYFRNLLTEESINEQGFTLLHRIVLGLHGKHLRTFLDGTYYDVNISDAYGRTPLTWAAWRGDASSVKQLLDAGAEIDTSDWGGYTALSRAAGSGRLECVRILLRAGASTAVRNFRGSQPIHLACKAEFPNSLVVAELIRFGADLASRGEFGRTPLHYTAVCGTIETVECLVSYGANIDALDEDGETPALTALEKRQEPIFLYLAGLGTDLNTTWRGGLNILHIATIIGSIEIWEHFVRLAKKGRLSRISVEALHDGHTIWECFWGCRHYHYLGARDIGEERTVFKEMIEAIRTYTRS